jgi:iron complex transport system substrate-binding protein
MKVVKTGRTYLVNEAIWNSSGGILAAELMVKDVERIFGEIK